MGETVLAIEDSKPLRRAVARQLRDLGYGVIEADNAAAALLLLDAGKGDLVFSDIVLPGPMNGFAPARHVVERWPHSKIVLTSGFPDAGSRGDPAAAGTGAPAREQALPQERPGPRVAERARRERWKL